MMMRILALWRILLLFLMLPAAAPTADAKLQWGTSTGLNAHAQHVHCRITSRAQGPAVPTRMLRCATRSDARVLCSVLMCFFALSTATVPLSPARFALLFIIPAALCV